MRESVGVFGAGPLGTTIARIAADNQAPTWLWTKDEGAVLEINERGTNDENLPGVELGTSLRATTEVSRVCAECDVLVLAVATSRLEPLLEALLPHLGERHVFVLATRGFVHREGLPQRISELVRDKAAPAVAVIGGPIVVAELSQRQPGGMVIASEHGDIVQRFQRVFSNRYFRVYGSEDVVGVEIATAMTSVVAIAAGVVDGLGLGHGSRALLVARALQEMTNLGAKLGARPQTFSGLAGIGDLVATCGANRSANSEIGRQLALGLSLSAVQVDLRDRADGIGTARAVYALANEHKLDLPIVEGTCRLFEDKPNVAQVLSELMKIPTGQEFPRDASSSVIP